MSGMKCIRIKERRASRLHRDLHDPAGQIRGIVEKGRAARP